MDLNYLTIFNLSENYSKDDLNKAFIEKIKNIDNLDLNSEDKQLLMDGYIHEYKIAKSFLNKNNFENNFGNLNLDFFNNFNNNFNNFNNNFNSIINEFQANLYNNTNNTNSTNSNVYSQSYSINKVINNGISTVIEKKNINDNGKIDNNISSFIIDKDGKNIPIDYKQAIENINSIYN